MMTTFEVAFVVLMALLIFIETANFVLWIYIWRASRG